ncbi:TPA: hypothetical protein JI095_16795 [Acinetobacter baumannii]|nr:hypothetical protein CYQ93_02955 [Acinetobacter baumannii]HAV5381708.1 hypothetical protein [Acinetobacter baumannii]
MRPRSLAFPKRKNGKNSTCTKPSMREKDEANIIAVFSLTPKPKFMWKKHDSDGFNNDLSENPISYNFTDF